MITLTRNGLSLALSSGEIPATGSAKVPVQFINDDTTYLSYNIQPNVGWFTGLIYKEAICEFSANTIYLPAEAFAQAGTVTLSISLIDPSDSNHIEVTNKAILEVNKSPAGTVILPTEDTWQTTVENYVSQLFNDFTVDQMYPVGSIYTSINSANPSTYFGGAWQRFGQGQVLVGVNESDPDFATVKKTGGEKKHTLIVNEIPSHTHQQYAHTHLATTASAGDHTHDATAASAGSHNHDIGSRSTYNINGNGFAAVGDGIENVGNYKTSKGGAHTHTLTVENAGAHTHTMTVNNATAKNRNTGGGFAHNNLQPYITVYMWLRTA